MFQIEISQITVILIEIFQIKAKALEVQNDIVIFGTTQETVLLETAYFYMRNHQSAILTESVIGRNVCILT